MRADLLERYRSLALPTTRDEHWRFTNLEGFDPDAWTADASSAVAVPSMLGVKLDAVAVPPFVFETVFTSVSVVGWSLLVIVQVAFWPGVSVSVPFAAQSPPQEPAV